MNETDFQELFTQWKSSQDPEKYKIIKDEVHRFIYEYPRSRFFVEDDVVSEFYTEYIERVDDFIDSYDSSYHVPFLIYMKVMIRRRFMNFLIKRNKNKKYENIGSYYEVNESSRYGSVFDHRAGYSATPVCEREEAIEKAMSCLSPDEELVVRIYFGFPLRLPHLRLMVRYNCSPDLFKRYRTYCGTVEKWFKDESAQKKDISERLNFLDFELKVLEGPLRSRVVNGKRERKKRLIQSYYLLRNAIPMKQVSELLNKNISFVYRRLHRGRKKLFDELSRQVQYSFEELRKSA